MAHGGASNSGASVFMAGRQLSTFGAVNTDTAVIYNNPECVTSSSLNTPSFDHFQIVHDGQGLTCAPEEVTIKACADANCETFNMDAIDVDLSIYNQTDDTLFKTIPITVNGTTAVMKDTNIPANFSYTNSGRVRLAIENQDDECKNGSSDSCEVKFTKAGFRFLYGDDTTLPNQIAGTIFEETLKLQAVIDDEGVCTGLFKDDISVNLWQENVTPKVTSGLSFSIEGNDIAKEQGEALTALIFDDNSIATIEDPRYHDAGEIRLHANYDVDGITLSGSSNLFWVSPAELVVSATSGISDLNGATATDTTTHVAGESFTLTVSAFNSLGVITPNYTPGNMQLKLERTGPTLEDSVDGRLTYASDASLASATGTSTVFESVTLNNFSSGQSVYTNAQYSEVGLLNLALRDSNYGNADIVIEATAIDIGRFTPAYFEQKVVEQGSLDAVCNQTTTTFAYTGQMTESVPAKGAISYLTNPVVQLTAKNVQGAIVKNYTEPGYNKFSAAANFIRQPTTDFTILGENNKPLPLTAELFAGTLSLKGLVASASSFDAPLGAGILHYELASEDNFFYPRNENSEVIAQDNDIDFLIDKVNFVDSDGIGITNPVDITNTASINLRFGRALIENSFGPETANLPQNFSTQYLNASDNYVLNEKDSCTIYDTRDDTNNITLTSGTLNKNLTGVNAVTGPLAEGKTRAMILTAPGAGNRGSIEVEYTIYNWLKYDWDWNGVSEKLYNQNPTATATFGLFRGNDRIIYQREVFE
jgi:MSHA biogenesis protein MshQ